MIRCRVGVTNMRSQSHTVGDKMPVGVTNMRSQSHTVGDKMPGRCD